MVLTGLNKNIAINQIKDRVLLLVEVMKDSIREVVNEDNAEFNQVSQDVIDNIITIIINDTISDSILDLFESYDLVGENAADRYKLSKNLFTFAEQETKITSNIDLANSLDNIDKQAQLNALILGNDNAAQIQFGNLEELNIVLSEIDEQYQRLIADPNNSSDSRVALLDLKTNTFNFFSQLDLAEIINETTTQLPSLALSYQFYGSTQFSDDIVNLNPVVDTGFIKGDIKILSSNEQ